MSKPRHRTAAEAVKKIRLQVKCRAIDESDLNFQSNDLFLETGAYGKVKRAQFEGVQVAVKYFRSAEEKRGYNQELVFLSCLQKHDNIVTLFGTGLSKNSKEPYIVMEFAPYSLERVLHGPVPRYWYGPDHVMHWSRQVAVGLQYIHEKRILHRDIKASNLLLFGNGSHLKLCDFGTCRNLETNLLYTANIGTVRYMAPEVIKGEPYTTKCDIFSFAITLWEMIARKVPTVDASAQLNTYAILFQMAEGKRPPLFTDVPVIITELLVTCWHQEPHMRLPSAEVAKKLINICKYFEFGQPLGYETSGSDETGFESMSSTCTDEKILSEQNEEEEEPSSPIIPDEYHMSRTQSDLTQVKAVIEELNNKEKKPIPLGYHPQMSIPVVQQQQKYLPTFQNFSHGYPPHDSYPSPKGIRKKDDMSMVMRKNSDGGPEIMVDHEVHEVLDPNSEDKRYVSLDENRLRFDVQCQYLQIEQAYQSQHASLPSRVSSILKSQSSRNLGETSKACGNSPYVIPGLPPDLQPVIPNESDPESIRIWENYKKLTQHLKPS